METFEYSKSRRKEIQRQKSWHVIKVLVAGVVGGVLGYLANGEFVAAILAPFCGLIAHYMID